MAKDVVRVEKQLKLEQIITLYYLGSESEGSSIVCDLTFHPTRNADGYTPISSHPGEHCPLCLHSSAIPIVDEHFIPQGVKTEPIVIAAKDAPDDLSEFFKRIVGKSIFRVNYREPESNSVSGEIYLDIENLFRDEDFLGVDYFRDRFDWIASHCVPANTRRIISLNDSASLALSARLKAFAHAEGKEIEVVTARRLQESLSECCQEGGSTLVVASVASTGRALTEVAKNLRYAQSRGAIKYIVGITKFPKDEDLRSIRSHLTCGDFGPGEHSFHTMATFQFPTSRSDRASSWKAELDLLSSDLDELPEMLEERAEKLRDSSSTMKRGLSNCLFLSSMDGRKLALRPRFAFWQFDYQEPGFSVSQADVYATIIAVLHRLRNAPRKSQRSLRQSEHVRRIISPRCFERYNDGIIQAAIVRAALPIELDYSVNDNESEVMAGILHTVFAHRFDSIGEAALELLFGLAVGKIRLVHSHIDGLSSEFAGLQGVDNPWWSFFWRKIHAIYGIESQ